MVRPLIVGAVWLTAGLGAAGAVLQSRWWWLIAIPALLLAGLGTWDLLQTRHTILRSYPILGHARFLYVLVLTG